MVEKIQSDIDKSISEINRHKVQIETGQKMTKKLVKGVEDSKKEKERIVAEKEKLLSAFKEIEKKAFSVQENYKIQEVEADYKLQDLKKACKELEIKGKGFKKRLDDLKIALLKHMEQIQKDLVVALLEEQLKEMNQNLDSISEYWKKVLLYNDRVEELNNVTQQRDDLKK